MPDDTTADDTTAHDTTAHDDTSGDSPLTATIVHACVRDGMGGSPTAVLPDTGLDGVARRAVPGLAGTSHAVFVGTGDAGAEGPEVTLRFFTATGELPACGHGTVAALAYLAERAGGREHRTALRTRERAFTGRTVRANGRLRAEFALGPVDLRAPGPGEAEPVLDALGPAAWAPSALVRVASVGRPRLLVPVATRARLAALAPDFGRLRAACDRSGLLGCCVYTEPTDEGRLAARMFAPSIGVPEDIANANSTGCLAAHLAGRGLTGVTADLGDALGSPSTVTAAAGPPSRNPAVRRVRVGGAAIVAGTVRLPLRRGPGVTGR
ncbi:PhzF family phenazine biosynthesis protein [Streptomyces puniciscabiei]|uniref:PhzF family phenazine biosynthesis protein n=1 Tax=Streptomyces puniciscabiei TaxID=164348 RepID=A0A542UKI3_9ACTN|nr:PhzF family phenazine biosynthesis protein [Streptomyces puniciscabiei]TQK99593.1 PhzF family phenazine biosynthesis protein [Streptomyces puniciscabiei]